MNKDVIPKALANLDELDALLVRKMDLHQKLRKALHLILLSESNPFSHKKPVTTKVTGNPHNGSLTFHIVVDGGEHDSFPLEQVPVILWPQHVIDDIPLWRNNRYRKILRKEKKDGTVR